MGSLHVAPQRNFRKLQKRPLYFLFTFPASWSLTDDGLTDWNMRLSKNKVVLQRQQKQYHEHCCVPECTASAKFNGTLSFHGFPSNEELRKRWVVNVRREHYTITSHSKVCSRHFTENQLIPPKSLGGKRRLQKGSVPVLFKWNDYSIPPPRSSVWDRVSRPDNHEDDDVESFMESLNDGELPDTEPTLDMAMNKIKILEEEMESLKREMEGMKLQSSFGVNSIRRGYSVLHKVGPKFVCLCLWKAWPICYTTCDGMYAFSRFK